MRLFRIAAATLAVLLLLAVPFAWLGPRLLDWNRYRDTLASLASTGLGRPVHIAGPVSLTIFPQPVLVASGVTLDASSDGAGATMQEMRLQVALGPLLAGRLDVRDLVLRGAEMHLPWPPRPGALQQRPPSWLTGLHARVEDSALRVGGLAFSDVDATLAIDPLTGTLSVSGAATALGRRWQVTARLGRAGNDGTAPIALSLDGEGATQDTGGTLSGQIAADGSLTGQVSGRGRDLSQLIAGPASPWHAAGRFYGADGLALADELDVQIGDMPARGAVALRLLPVARVDAALAASRLDLDAWLPRLLRGGGMALPTSVDLSAEAASLAGGTLRHVRAAFDLDMQGAMVREAEAVLPGDAALTLSGRVVGGRFDGTGQLTAPALRETLRWLQPTAPPLLAALPPGVLRAATLAGTVAGEGGRLTLAALKGTIDGAPASGSLSLLGGDRPAFAGTLRMDGLVLDPWLPSLPADLAALGGTLGTWPGRFGGFDAELALVATRPSWHGTPLDRLDIDAALQAGTLALRRASVTGPDLTASARGTLAPSGRVSDASLSLSLAHASLVDSLLPRTWRTGLLRGPASLQASAAGDPQALASSLTLNVADMRLDATGTADLAKPGWSGTLAVQHPGAPRLLERLGLAGVAPWLGDGSFSLAATLALDPARAALGGLTLSAGALHATGDLVLDRLPPAAWALTGRLAAETLPLPLPYARSLDPLPLPALRGWRVQLGLTALHVLFGLSPGVDRLAATVAMDGGIVRLTGLSGEVGGGKLAGQAALDISGVPRLSVQGSLAGAALAGPLLDGAIDVSAGRMDAAIDLAASGFSPAAMLATLAGTAHLTVQDGLLAGLDLQAVTGALARPDAAQVQAGVAAGLAGGGTAFVRLDGALALRGGVLSVQPATVDTSAGAARVTGTIDLPIDSADLNLAFSPALAGAPGIGLRLIGPASSPRRAPELAALAGWLVAR